jgi:hypothetical protein
MSLNKNVIIENSLANSFEFTCLLVYDNIFFIGVNDAIDLLLVENEKYSSKSSIRIDSHVMVMKQMNKMLIVGFPNLIKLYSFHDYKLK